MGLYSTPFFGLSDNLPVGDDDILRVQKIVDLILADRDAEARAAETKWTGAGSEQSIHDLVDTSASFRQVTRDFLERLRFTSWFFTGYTLENLISDKPVPTWSDKAFPAKQPLERSDWSIEAFQAYTAAVP